MLPQAITNRGPFKLPRKLLVKVPGKITSVFFGPAPLSRDRAVGLSERLAAATSLTSSLEHLVQRRTMDKGGMADWDIIKGSLTGSSPLVRRLINGVSGPGTTTALHVGRVAVSAGMLLPGNSRWRGAGSLFLGVSSALLGPRHHYGGEGSDQVATLVQIATGTARLALRRRRRTLCCGTPLSRPTWPTRCPAGSSSWAGPGVMPPPSAE